MRYLATIAIITAALLASCSNVSVPTPSASPLTPTAKPPASLQFPRTTPAPIATKPSPDLTVWGEVIDAETREPIPWAEVTLDDQPAGSAKFSITVQSAGVHQFRATAAGYEDYHIDIRPNFKTDKVLHAVIQMKRAKTY